MDVLGRVLFVFVVGLGVTTLLALAAGGHRGLPCVVIVPLVLVGVFVARGAMCSGRREVNPGAGEAMTPKCSRCGHHIPDRPGARFCPVCGARLEN